MKIHISIKSTALCDAIGKVLETKQLESEITTSKYRETFHRKLCIYAAVGDRFNYVN